jgi:acyl carrier protein
MNDSLAARVKQTMALVFNVPAAEIGDDAEIMTVRGWDSLGHANLMLALEEEFGVAVPPEAQVELQSLPEIVDFLRAQAVA